MIHVEDTPWVKLPDERLGRYRASATADFFVMNDGGVESAGNGYAMCLSCGRTEPMPKNLEQPISLEFPHNGYHIAIHGVPVQKNHGT